MIEPALVILFDGVCNLCNNSVQFVIKHDKKKKFKFASLQSDFGQQTLQRLNLDTEKFNSFIFLENNKPRFKSTGVLYVFKKLGGLFLLLFAFIIVPRHIRDWIYDNVAQNRYKWFGKREQCMVPTPDLQSRFLS